VHQVCFTVHLNRESKCYAQLKSVEFCRTILSKYHSHSN